MAEEKASLYTRLGGYDAIYAFAAAALRNSMADPVIGHIWDHMSESTFQKEHINFVDFLCREWGGNAVYRGRDMMTAHRGRGITEEYWQALLVLLEKTYDDFGVPADLRAEVNQTFEKYKKVIVGSPSYRDVVLSHPHMDITKGMKSVGVIWPPRRDAANAPDAPGRDLFAPSTSAMPEPDTAAVMDRPTQTERAAAKH